MIRDIGILWEWQYDERFVRLLDSLCHREGKMSYLVSAENLDESVAKINSGELWFRVVFDRATDSNPAFMPIIHLHHEGQSRIINEHVKAARANTKIAVHFELIKMGINVPHSIILSPFEWIDDKILDTLGLPFVIKPAEEGGGGAGVFLTAKTIDDIQRAREDQPGKFLLIQELIVPKEFQGSRYWFRIFFVCGKVIPCFWDDHTHIYRRLIPEQEKIFEETMMITRRVHEITGLEFFSTEIAQKKDEKFVVVDYVNDQCDMRFQSETPDGVPDSVVDEIAKAIIDTL